MTLKVRNDALAVIRGLLIKFKHRSVMVRRELNTYSKDEIPTPTHRHGKTYVNQYVSLN
ncbi:hypothetical protein MCAMS1_00244 [biofilm metagenome]